MEVLPIAGREDALAQPYVLEGAAADRVLEDIRVRSAELGATLEVRDGIGVIDVDG